MPLPFNAASVPHRSPFRYPGGKTWFVPIFRQWVGSLKAKPRAIIEPFAGGGIISLTALFEDLVEVAVMVELDDEVGAVWQTIVEGGSGWLADKVLSFTLTKETLEEELRKTSTNVREKAFQTILKNRVLYGGILARGSGFIKNGEAGKGIVSRWYPKTLARRLLDLQKVAHRIDFRQDDGLKVMKEFAHRSDVVYFIDPPYTLHKKGGPGRRLYKHHDVDHGELFRLCRSLAGDFLMTYNKSEEVVGLAHQHGLAIRAVPMKTAHHVLKEELVIAKDLAWLDNFLLQEAAVGECLAKYVLG